MNVNAHDTEPYKGWRQTVPAERIYNDRMEFYNAPDGHIYAFKLFGNVGSVTVDDADAEIVRKGFVSVSRIHSQPQFVPDGEL